MFYSCFREVDVFRYREHAIFGLICAAGVSYVTGLKLTGSHIAGVLFGVMLPDMDHPQSKINYKILKFNNRVWKVCFYVTVGIVLLTYGLEHNHVTTFLGLAMIWTGVSNHRTFTHSILGGVFFCAALFQLNALCLDKPFFSAAMFGYWSHLVSDSVTKAGVNWFYPVKDN